MSRPIAILIAGDPIESVRQSRGSYADMIRRASGDRVALPFVDLDIRSRGVLPDPRTFAGIVVTGSASSVTDREDWVVQGEAYLRRVVETNVPVFGICFGHQMLGQALGGLVERNPRGREIGTVKFRVVSADPILAAATAPFLANATHVDSVTLLPPGAKVLATTEREPHAAVRFSENAWGVQFHPEMDGDVVREYVRARGAILNDEGLDADALATNARDGVAGTSTLLRFLDLFAE
ncbi:MAG TPA: glutamine amidotransferase [Polyangiaceae bacterium]|nr:glutamine amidotransferase [Polyangiaceae bacterium]